ncbi:MAG: hypothetical protein HY552_06235 [Elusimicrobia bacterium]|nr:hypothetical protein [Elusimicrobiota bacterium]
MLDKDGNVAHWLGWDYAPGRLDEPINVIVRVKADTADEANQKLLKALADAGFSIRLGHTNGYQAYLGTGRYRFPQWPAASGGTFSDGAATGPNNHGRLFGPVRFRGMYYFIGAFSWEDGPVHAYKSFKNARDAFARQMQALAGAVRGPDVPLDNAIPPGSSPIETTDDHDGSAALIELP